MDTLGMTRVLRNLIGNAVKFSPDKGRIEIATTKEEGFARISVRDHGPGIPEKELGVIFDKFIQSKRTKTGAGGTGLGLSITREIVAAHGGRVWAENHPEGGAVFFVELPMFQSEESEELRPVGRREAREVPTGA